MKKRRLLWVLTVLVALTGAALLYPRSPAYLPVLFERYGHYQDGHRLGYWVGALQSPDAATRSQAIVAIGSIGSGAAEAVPALARILTDDPDSECRHQAALALSKMTPASREAVPALARALEDDELFVRLDAAFALSRLHQDARPAVPALVKAVQDPGHRTNLGTFHFTIQEFAALALGRATAGTDEGVPALTEALEGARTSEARQAMARALGEVGPEARPAVPQLRALLQDKDKNVREVVEEALQKIEGAPAQGR